MKIIIDLQDDNLTLKEGQLLYEAIKALHLAGVKIECIIDGNVGSMAKYVMK